MTSARRSAAAHLSAAGAIALAILAFGSASALASYTTHPFAGSFGPEGPHSHTVFGSVQGVAVDRSTGDVYVYEAGNGGSVSKFNSVGEPVSFSGLEGTAHPNVIEGVGSNDGDGENELAVDSSSGPDAGDIYVANSRRVGIYGADGKPVEVAGKPAELTGEEACGVAVDATGVVYVGFYPGTVRRYTPVANPVTDANETASMGGLNEVCNVAVDGSGNVYAATYSGGVSKYEALEFGSLAAAGTPVDGQGRTLAVDASNEDVYVDEGSDIAQYDSSGSLLSSSGATGPGALGEGSVGVAVNGTTGKTASGDLYASDRRSGLVNIYSPAVNVAEAATEAPTGVSNNAATLHGTVNPEEIPVSACQFEYGTEAGVLSHTIACSPAPGAGNAPVAVSAELSGLAASRTYYYRLAASDADATNYGAEASFTTLGPPAIVSESAEVNPTRKVGQTTAVLGGQVDPDGPETTYQFEYGETSSYGTSVPASPAALGSGEQAVQVPAAELAGLKVGTTYHYRISASNEYGTTEGSDQEFTTLPPARIDEESALNLAATSVTLSAQINPLGSETSYYFQYGTVDCTASPASCADAPLPPGTVGFAESDQEADLHLQDLFANTTYHYRVVAHNELGTVDGSDHTFTTEAPGSEFALPDGRQYELVSPANKYGTEVLLDYSGGGIHEASEAGDKFTFVTTEPTVANPAGNGSGSQSLATRGASGWTSQEIDPPNAKPTGLGAGAGTQYKAFSANLSSSLLQHEAFAGETPLGGQLFLRGGIGGYQPLATTAPPGEPYLNAQYLGVTPDLSHVVFSSSLALTPNAYGGQAYKLYDWSGGSIQLVSVLPDGQAAGGGNFGSTLGQGNQGDNTRNAISRDGSHVVWTVEETIFDRDVVTGETVEIDRAQGSIAHRHRGLSDPEVYQIASGDGSRVFFTFQSALTAGASEENLYEFNTGSGRLSEGKLTDLTSGAAVQGVLGVSEDGTYVYCVARGDLAPGATNGDDLYLLHYDGTTWTTKFIATLSGADQSDWTDILYSSSARVSPDGRYVTFMSQESLTGYDNADATSGQPDQEVYLYDANAGRLVCVSCNPTGARPTGEYDNGHLSMDVSDIWYELSNRWVASVLPAWEKYVENYVIYQPRFLSDEGRVFFDSADALVPQDINGKEDVYEYEPDGVGSCRLENGCIYLISSGVGSEDSTFLDASANGNDVFFRTRDRLVSQDFDRAFDVYDAHACSAAAPCLPSPPVTPPPCTTGDSCKAAPTPQPPIFGAPASATFAGLGNPTPPVSKPPVQSTGKSKSKPKPKSKKKRHARHRKRAKRSRARRSGFGHGSSAGGGR